MHTASASPDLNIDGERFALSGADVSSGGLALNAAAISDAIGAGVALNFEGDQPPAWVQMLPRGPKLQGHDGRAWIVPDPQALVEAFNADGLDLPVDINHATQIRALKGEDAPAVGWIKELEARNGELFGRVEWNGRGRQALIDRDYRYVSPVFRFDASGRVTKMRGLGLVNAPNFIDMPALNAEQAREEPMDKDLLKKLDLAETATAADAIVAVDKLLTAANAQRPSLEDYVPRADHTLALNRAETAERALADRQKADHDEKVARAIGDAIKTGKIAPASKDFYEANCASAEGLTRFLEFVAAQPSHFTPVLDNKDVDAGEKIALNAEQKAAATAMGLDETKFAEFIAGQTAA